MKEFTYEMLKKLHRAYEETIATPQSHKYRMQYDYKQGKRWHYCTHTIPHNTGIIKTFKGKTYIICDGFYTDGNRYHVTDEVKELLGI